MNIERLKVVNDLVKSLIEIIKSLPYLLEALMNFIEPLIHASEKPRQTSEYATIEDCYYPTSRRILLRRHTRSATPCWA